MARRARRSGQRVTRSATELGAGLAPARAARAIRAGERIHVIGIAGAGASAAALLAKAAGAIVTGCDAGGPSPYTPAVEAAGIPMEWSHHPSHVEATPHPDRLAVTKALTSIDPHNPELEAAAALGIPAEPWQQVIADAAVGRTLVAVAGTHGKSTTAGWLTWVLAQAGLDPSAFVGGLLPASLTGGLPGTARIGQGSVFVVEADEYAGNFDAYRPDVVALTTIEWDHPDVFATRAAVVDAFTAWLLRVPRATIVAEVGDSGVYEVVQRLGNRQGRVCRVTNFDEDVVQHEDILAGILAMTPEGTLIEIHGLGNRSTNALIPLAGSHNVGNAIVVAGAARELGVRETTALVSGLESFPGIGRRLERKGEGGGVVVYDDYGHHPTAIRVTIEAMRQREPGRRLWAVYEPLTFHRTAALLDDFAAALAGADAVAVADIWASRDPDTTITSPEALVDAVRALRPQIVAEAPGSVEATAAWLAANVRAGDAVLVMGGGKSYRIAELLLEALNVR
jgi:UDP-N-acetylmuramate--alanine ligase